MELLHVVRDNINFDLRDTFPAWFKEYPMIHLMAHYPAPWPASENEFRIPADREIQQERARSDAKPSSPAPPNSRWWLSIRIRPKPSCCRAS